MPGSVLALVALLADQYTKWLVIEKMLRIENPFAGGFFQWLMTERKIEFFMNEREAFNSIELAPFLNFVMVWNQGISFGLFDSNEPVMAVILTAVALAASLLLLIGLAVASKKTVATALGLIIGGALGNALDRIRFGAVADFVDVHAGSWHWPAFNLADSCIVIGAGIMIIETFASGRRPNHAQG